MSNVEESIFSWRPAKLYRNHKHIQPVEVRWTGSIDSFDFEQFRARIKRIERHGLKLGMIYAFSSSLFARFLLG